VGSLRRRDESLARLLLSSVPPLGGAAHCRRLGLPVRRTTGLRARELDRPRGDVERLRPAQDANVVAAQQVEALLGRLEEGVVPLFVFDAGYDPLKLQLGLEGSPCQILVRLRAGRRFYGDPSLSDPPAHVGRPRRQGAEDEVR
jgi:hypothetical protein